MKNRVEVEVVLPLPLEAFGNEAGIKNVHERTLQLTPLWVVWCVSYSHPAGGKKADWMVSLREAESLSSGEQEGQLSGGCMATMTGNSRTPRTHCFVAGHFQGLDMWICSLCTPFHLL